MLYSSLSCLPRKSNCYFISENSIVSFHPFKFYFPVLFVFFELLKCSELSFVDFLGVSLTDGIQNNFFSLFNTSLSLSAQVLLFGWNSDVYLLIWPGVAHIHFLHHGILWILLAVLLKPLTILSTTLVTLDSVAAVCDKNEAEHVTSECETV